MKNKLITSKELAKLLKISPSTVNYYTAIGIFKVKQRRGNKRFYDKGQIKLIFNKISQMRKEGYPLTLIKKELSL